MPVPKSIEVEDLFFKYFCPACGEYFYLHKQAVTKEEEIRCIYCGIIVDFID